MSGKITHEIDKHGSVRAMRGGKIIAVTWGPAVDNGEWFVLLPGDQSARRVGSRDEAVALLPEPTL